MNRRDFLNATASGLTAIGTAATLLGANDRVRLAICGLHGRGKDHLHNYSQIQNVQIAALCDVDENVLGERLAQMEKMGLPKPVTYGDVRKLLEDKSIDAVSIATPNHWHALMAVWAMQAGKDVYVEKPCSHNVSEGRIITDWARKLGRMCQMGVQSRSMTGMRQLIDFIHSGKLGKISVARAVCYKRRPSIGL